MASACDLPQLLRELERRLDAFGAPIVEAFRPGASAEEVRSALAAEGHRAHADMVAWWGWHDGVALGGPPVESGPGVYVRAENTLVEDWHVLSVADAVRTHRAFRDDYGALAASELLPGGWFPILATGAKPTLWVDCSVGDDEPAPLYVDEHLPKPDGPLYASLADFVAMIITAFDKELVRGHPEDVRVPIFDAPRLPDELRRLSYW